MTEDKKFQIIKSLVDTNGNKQAASIKIGCSIRHINRLISRYKSSGKSAFVHGNRGRIPATALDELTKHLILSLYQTSYAGANITHFCELLAENENITVSATTVTSILRKSHILSPKATRNSRRALKRELKQLQDNNKSKKKNVVIQKAILDLEDAHPRRPRCAYFGEMIQMDASEYVWFGDTKAHLHIAIDDATGTLIGAYFDTQETLNGYYNTLYQILLNYGIPYQFFTDNRTVFEYNKKKEHNVEKDTFTQFGYACKQLGINIRTSSVPQSKGRVERANQTLQSRLTTELTHANVSSIEDANTFLNSYIKKFNKRFALPIDSIKSVFEKQPNSEKINLLLAVLSPRKIDNGSSIKYQKAYYLPTDCNGVAVHYRKGTSAMVIKAFDGKLYTTIKDAVYSLKLLEEHQPVSKAFDPIVVLPKSKKIYIPPMSHPWKCGSFKSYADKRSNSQEYA
jgi:transposase